MSTSHRARLVVRAETLEPYDALSRLLADGQRFGIGLSSLRAEIEASGISRIEMVVVAERGSLEHRLSRHPSIAELVIEDAAEDARARPGVNESGAQERRQR